MDGETIVYIIIGLVYFISSILSSRKKKREKEAKRKRAAEQGYDDESSPEPVPAEQTLEEMFGELFNPQEEGKQRKPDTTPPVPVEEVIRERTQEEQYAFETKTRKDKQDADILEREQHMKRQRDLANAFVQNAAVVTRSKRRHKPGKIYKNISAKDAIIGKIILERRYQ